MALNHRPIFVDKKVIIRLGLCFNQFVVYSMRNPAVSRTAKKQSFANCVRSTRTQPLICVGCSVHYWVSCAINKGGFFEIAFVVVVDTHLPRFEALAYVLPHFDALTHVVILVSSAFITRDDVVSQR